MSENMTNAVAVRDNGPEAMVRQYREVVIQHRRSMLMLNTAVGQRILP